jgi:hypothetical protein
MRFHFREFKCKRSFILVILGSIILIFILLSVGSLTENDEEIGPIFLELDNAKSFSSNKNVKCDFYRELVTDPNRLVDQYIEKPDNSFGSGLIPLLVSALMTQGDILELGMGFFSTALLNKVAVKLNRTVVSVDSNREWIANLSQYVINSCDTSNCSGIHKHVLAESMKEMHAVGANKTWGLVLVDHRVTDQRYLDVKRFAGRAQIVVAHDAEDRSDFMYLYKTKKVIRHFKYGCKFSLYGDSKKKYYTSTLVLSNFIDLDVLNVILKKVNTDFGSIPCDFRY